MSKRAGRHTIRCCNKANLDWCIENHTPIIIPSVSELEDLDQEGRQRAFLFAATGDITWLQYPKYDLPALENRFIKKDEEV